MLTMKLIGSDIAFGPLCVLHSSPLINWCLSIHVDIRKTDQRTSFDTSSAFDPASRLRTKMAELHNFVESKLALAASKQKYSYKNKSHQRSFIVNDCLALYSHCRKLEKGIETSSYQKNAWMSNYWWPRKQVVNINRIQPHIVPSLPPSTLNDSALTWIQIPPKTHPGNMPYW